MAVLNEITHWWQASGKYAFAPHRRLLVANPITHQLAFELCERQQDVQHQSTHAVRHVEGLRDADEAYSVPIHQINQTDEVEQRAGQPVNLVYDDDIDAAGFDVGN